MLGHNYLFNMNAVTFMSQNALRRQGAPSFHFGIGVQPEGRNRRVCELTTAEFGTLVN